MLRKNRIQKPKRGSRGDRANVVKRAAIANGKRCAVNDRIRERERMAPLPADPVLVEALTILANRRRKAEEQ